MLLKQGRNGNIHTNMLKRFCLYGFLKNQRYFEPFFVLVFMERGLSFFEIGLLLGYRDVLVFALEIPTGAVADLRGHRACLIYSFLCYILSFVVFAVDAGLGLLFVAMTLFGVGEAFRTGTHKAIIFAWLHDNNRLAERTRIYGYTRSWSKLGSAVSVVLAAVFVWVTDDYASVFAFATIPYVLGIVNLMGYPKHTHVLAEEKHRPVDYVRHIAAVALRAFREPHLRRLFAESVAFDGTFQATKHYVQPVALAIVLAASSAFIIPGELDERARTAILIAAIYFVLHLLESVSSRHSHVIESMNDGNGIRVVWIAGVCIFVAMAISAYTQSFVVLIATFVLMHALHTAWRPMVISRFAAVGHRQMATVLSSESQVRHAASAILTPLVGLAVDLATARHIGGPLWPAGLLGTIVTIVLLASAFRRRHENAALS